MKLEDLKNGAVIKTRNGNYYFKMDNCIINLEDGLDWYVSDYDNFMNLDNREYDIIKYDNDVCGTQNKTNNNSEAIFRYLHRNANNVEYDCEETYEYSLVNVENEILEDKEKEYLENVCRPFKDKILCIEKASQLFAYNLEFICITLKNNDCYPLPNFHKDTMYKGMKIDKQYTLQKLGLFKGEQE